jgi:hypothetical protein
MNKFIFIQEICPFNKMTRLCPRCQSCTVPGKVKRGIDNRLWVSTELSDGSYRWLRKPTKRRQARPTKARTSYVVQTNTGERQEIHVADRREHREFCEYLKRHNINIVFYANDPSKNIIMSLLHRCNQRGRRGVKRMSADNPVVHGDKKMRRIG